MTELKVGQVWRYTYQDEDEEGLSHTITTTIKEIKDGKYYLTGGGYMANPDTWEDKYTLITPMSDDQDLGRVMYQIVNPYATIKFDELMGGEQIKWIMAANKFIEWMDKFERG